MAAASSFPLSDGGNAMRLLRAASGLALIALCIPVACSLFQGNRNTTNANRGNAGAVRYFTDTDTVTGVAAVGTNVYVGTHRGVLRYASTGGTPTRFTTHEGLSDDDVLAIAASPEGTVWAAGPHGVTRLNGEAWVAAGAARPNVGRPTALYAIGANEVLLGGAQGLARFDGTDWYLLTNRYQVVGFSSQRGRVLVATAQSGLLGLRGDYTGLDEYGGSAGIPELLVRDVVPLGNGTIWALVQGSNGAKLAYFDGHKWYGFTNEQVRSPWLALVPNEDRTGAALVVQGALYDIAPHRGDELMPTEASNADGQQRIELHPARIEPPPPPPPPPEPPPPPPPPTRGRGRAASRTSAAGADAGAGHASVGDAGAAHAAQGASDAGAAHATLGAPDAGSSHTAGAGIDGGVPRVAASSADGGRVASRTSGAEAGVALALAGDAATAEPDAAVSEPVQEPMLGASPGALRPREVPAAIGPVDVPHGGPTIEAPTFGLVRNSHVAIPDDVITAYGTPSGVFVVRPNLGVSNASPSSAADYRVHDLALRNTPLSPATDGHGVVWFTTDDGAVMRFDGQRLVRALLDRDRTVVPLLFWSRGTTAVAIARVGPNVVRTYRSGPSGWRAVTERPIDTRGAGSIHAKFLAVDERGRFWIGVRVLREGQSAMELGVAVIDDALPAATQFNSQVAPAGAEQGARPAPDDLTGITFDANGTAWFAGLSGATSIALPPGGAESTVHTYNETSGLRGDLVSDLARGPLDRIYIATPDGLGYWDGSHWGFDIEGSSAAPRAIALTVDGSGTLWGTGPRGTWAWDGQHFRTVGRRNGLPSDGFLDVAAAGDNRVWLAGEEGIAVYAPSAEH
jgi:hypothetical protein